jgi:hypothetical protein
VTQGVAPLVLEKLREQVERLDHLLALIPPGALTAAAPPLRAAMPLDLLLGHLLECLAGVCATLQAAHPERLAHFTRLRTLPVNHRCGVQEARDRIGEYLAHLVEGFACLTDLDLTRPIPTVFVPSGEAVLTLLLGNLEHLTNHKHQLFLYLKQLGVPVGTPDLYHWRGARCP